MANSCLPRGKQDLLAELPNLLLSTTYALNKSNSKSVSIGLQYNAGYYHEVIKLGGSGASHKNITLDRGNWKTFKDQFEIVSAYLEDSYDFYHRFGRPNKIFLQNLDVDFTTAYGQKSISISERPVAVQNFDDDESTRQPAYKKSKVASHPPGIVIQQATFEGLRAQSNLIDLKLNFFKEIVGKVNRTTDIILEYLKKELEKETPEDVKNIINNLKEFKRFYAIHNDDLNNYVTEKMVDDNNDFYKSQYLKIVLNEIVAFNLPFITNDLREYAFSM